MSGLVETGIDCPYCGETITVLVDGSIEQQQYTEDCSVCCHPIVFITQAMSGEPLQVLVRREDD